MSGRKTTTGSWLGHSVVVIPSNVLKTVKEQCWGLVGDTIQSVSSHQRLVCWLLLSTDSSSVMAQRETSSSPNIVTV